MTLDDLLALDRSALDALLTAGHPVSTDALVNREFHGVSLGLPRFVERLTWKKFKKVFVQRDDAIHGYNEAVEQNALDAPWISVRKRGEPVRYWHFHLRPCDERVPTAWNRGLLIDYAPPAKPWDVMRFMRDPLVAVNPGSADLLLGVSYAELGPLRIPTPTWFALVPGDPVAA
ncbi:MAG: hypothetical protein R3F61_17590 [Myxococcota bacterium]